MLRKVFFILLAAMILYLGGRWLIDALASDETRIRWLLEETAHAFNDPSARRLAGALAEDFRAENGRFDRRATTLAFIAFAREHSDAEGNFLYRCEIVDLEGLEIALERSQESAKASIAVRVLFHRRARVDAEERLASELEFSAELVEEDGDWRILEARGRVLRGQRPY